MAPEFPMENHIKTKAGGGYPPPSNDLFWSIAEISSSARMRAFFRLLSLNP
jgi:hypothetical protein